MGQIATLAADDNLWYVRLGAVSGDLAGVRPFVPPAAPATTSAGAGAPATAGGEGKEKKEKKGKKDGGAGGAAGPRDDEVRRARALNESLAGAWRVLLRRQVPRRGVGPVESRCCTYAALCLVPCVCCGWEYSCCSMTTNNTRTPPLSPLSLSYTGGGVLPVGRGRRGGRGARPRGSGSHRDRQRHLEPAGAPPALSPVVPCLHCA